jgi:hypothetical protein
MTRIEASVIIAAPPDEVFRYASDWQKWAEWFEGVSDFQPITEVLRGNGARYAYKARLLWFEASVETEITEFVEGRGWKGIARRGIPHTTYWLFEAVDAQTRFTFAQEYRIPIPVIGWLLDVAFIRKQWRCIIAMSLGNLKRHFETCEPGSQVAAGSHGAQQTDGADAPGLLGRGRPVR